MNEKQMRNFRENVKALMGSDGTTQRMLSEELKIDRSTISRMLSGEREPSIDFLFGVAKKYHRKVDDLCNTTVIKRA